MTNITVNQDGALVEESTGLNIMTAAGGHTLKTTMEDDMAFREARRVSEALNTYTSARGISDRIVSMDKYWEFLSQFIPEDELEVNEKTYQSLRKEFMETEEAIKARRTEMFPNSSSDKPKVKLSAQALKYLQGSYVAQKVLSTNLETGVYLDAVTTETSLEHEIESLKDAIESFENNVLHIVSGTEAYQEYIREMEESYEYDEDDDWDDWDDYDDNFEDEYDYWYDEEDEPDNTESDSDDAEAQSSADETEPEQLAFFKVTYIIPD